MISKLRPSRTVFFLCDIQEKLIPAIKEGNKIINVANRMVNISIDYDVVII